MARLRDRLALAAAALLIAAGLGACGRGQAPRVVTFQTMGTIARLEIHDAGPERDEAALAAVRAAYDSVTASMNSWDAESEISRASRAPVDSAFTLSPWLSRCLASAESLRDASGGAFDPTALPLMRLWGFTRRAGRLPSDTELAQASASLGGFRHDAAARRLVRTHPDTAFDLGGIAKGFAVDRAGEALRALGVGSALVDLGGNLRFLGAPSGKRAWRVGIRDPRDRERFFAALTVEGGALATSGAYERFVEIEGRRYGHIMNPATGRPAKGLLSATVLAPDATTADGLSTALYVLGPEDARRLLADRYPDAEAVLVLPPDGESGLARVLASRSLAGRLEILPEQRERYALEFF